jgi:hypothetical protein
MSRFMLGSHLLAALLGMLAILVSPPSVAADNRLEEKLDKPITLDKPIDKNTPLQDAYEFLAARLGVRITVDKEAFKKQSVDNLPELPVQLPKVTGVRLGLVLRLLSSQVNAGYEVKGDRVEIVPLMKSKKPAKRESKKWTEAAKIIREELKKPITLEKGIDANTPIKDVVELLSDRAALTIIIDVGTFHFEGVQNVEDMPVQLPVQKGVPLSEVLGKVLDQIKGTYEITGGAVVIVPAEKQDDI